MRASRGPWGAGSAVNTPLVNLMLELWCFFLVFILLEHCGVSHRGSPAPTDIPVLSQPGKICSLCHSSRVICWQPDALVTQLRERGELHTAPHSSPLPLTACSKPFPEEILLPRWYFQHTQTPQPRQLSLEMLVYCNR